MLCSVKALDQQRSILCSRRNRNLSCFIRLVLLITLARICSPVEANNALLRAHSPYLYAGDAYPVVEYIISRNVESEQRKEENSNPSFLYDTDPSYRLVEFYATRTEPAAIRLKHRYIELGYAVTEILQDYYPNITLDIYAICCSTVPSLCEKQGIEMNHHDSKPTFLMYTPQSSKGKKLEVFNASTILGAMNISFDLGGQSVQIDMTQLSGGKNVQMRTNEELKSDIHLSLYTFMKNNVFVDHDENENLVPLSTEKRIALKKYLLLLQKSLPSSWQVSEMVRGLMNSFLYISKNRAYLLAAMDEHAPLATTEYSLECQTGHVSGLTCGAWELIHAITVGVVERNKVALSKMEVKSDVATNFTDAHIFIPNEDAALVLRDFVHFFGLGDDEMERQELINHLDTCTDARCLSADSASSAIVSQWIKLPLFFSKVHSEITLKRQQQLAKQNKKSMTTFQKQMLTSWPPEYACPQCWDAHGNWDTNVVYKYMQLEYTDLNEWSMSSPEIRKELLGTKQEMISVPRQLLSNPYYNSSAKDVSKSIVLLMRQIVVLVTALGIILYRVVMVQHEKQQQASKMVLPHTVWSKVKIQRNKSLKQSNWLAFAIDHKKS
jgi:hypothetical protein